MAMVSSRSSGGSYTITTYSCRICNQTFNLKSDAEEHVRTKHSSAFANAFVCSICQEKFVTRKEAELHVQVRHPEQLHTYSCSLCTETFATKKEAQAHLRSQHPEVLQALVCPVCGEQVSTSDIRNHLRAKHPELLSMLEANRATDGVDVGGGNRPLRFGAAATTAFEGPDAEEPSARAAREKGKPWWRFWA